MELMSDRGPGFGPAPGDTPWGVGSLAEGASQASFAPDPSLAVGRGGPPGCNVPGAAPGNRPTPRSLHPGPFFQAADGRRQEAEVAVGRRLAGTPATKFSVADASG